MNSRAVPVVGYPRHYDIPSQGVPSIPLSSSYLFDVNILDVYLVVFCHYVSSFDDNCWHLSNCNFVCSWGSLMTLSVMLASHLSGSNNIRSTRCGSATTVDSVRGSAGIMHVPQQQQPQFQMPSQAYISFFMGPLQVGFSFRVQPPNNSYIMCLVCVVVFAFCFQVPT